MEENKIDFKKTMLSGIQPTGNVHIGNYLGAVKNFPLLAKEYNALVFLADLHSITVDIEPAFLRNSTLQLAAILLACGVDPKQTTLFVQSHVPCHAELCWVLNCFTYMGEAKRMTQFKDKSQKNAHNVNVGLLDYPVLQAADILLYKTDLVPVGKDQKQHLELARDLAVRFNNKYSPTFAVPEVYSPKNTAKIMSLSDPTAKMSKSDSNMDSMILLNDEPSVILKKFKRAVTDSDNSIVYDPKNKAGISNLLVIYSEFAQKSIEECQKEFEGKGYGQFKTAVGECVVEALMPIQQEYKRILQDKQYVLDVLKDGAQRAYKQARKTLSTVYRKIGFLS